MRQTNAFDNRYCTGCRCTTRHEVQEIVYACLRCGGIKYPAGTQEVVRMANVSSLPLPMTSLPKVCCA